MARGTVRVTKFPTSIDTCTARTCAGQLGVDEALAQIVEVRSSEGVGQRRVGLPHTHDRSIRGLEVWEP